MEAYLTKLKPDEDSTIIEETQHEIELNYFDYYDTGSKNNHDGKNTSQNNKQL